MAECWQLMVDTTNAHWLKMAARLEGVNNSHFYQFYTFSLTCFNLFVFQVQGTNDSSIVSKCSMAAQGYFKDDFLKLFVSSAKSRRAPLINRGYYIRAMIIDDVLKSFLAQFKDADKQVGGQQDEKKNLNFRPGATKIYSTEKMQKV